MVPREVRFIKQAGFNRCAHACLAMIASHYGAEIGPTHWLRKSDPVAAMPSVWHVVDWARGLGLKADAVEFGTEEVQDLRVPAILHCRNNHFIVLEAAVAGMAVIVDPRSGRVRASPELAAELFSGVAVEISPG